MGVLAGLSCGEFSCVEVFRKAGLWVRGKGNSKKTLKWTFLWLPSRRGGDPGRLVMLIFIVLPIATMAAACLLLSPWQEKCDWLDWEHWGGVSTSYP